MALNADSNDFSRMQHLIDEMDRSNQLINLFSEKFDIDDVGATLPAKRPPLEKQFEALFDDACRSEESDGVRFHEVQANQLSRDLEDSGYEKVINSAIAEVSNDFLSGLQASNGRNPLTDSDESRLSSDTDFKLLVGMPSYARYPETTTGLSDTDWNPYGTESDNNQSPRMQQDLRPTSKPHQPTSFHPVLNSTGLNSVTPNSPAKISPLLETHLGDDTQEMTTSLKQDLKPDDLTVPTPTSQVVELISPMKVYRKLTSSVLDQTMRGRELEVNTSHERISPNIEKEVISPKESMSSDEEKKIASTSSTGYSSVASGLKGHHEGRIEKVHGSTGISSQYMSVIESAKLMGVPESNLLDKTPLKQQPGYGKTASSKDASDHGYNYESDDHLGQRVHSLLSETAHLDQTGSKRVIDYNALQRDLQEIQDNLETFGFDNPSKQNIIGNFSQNGNQNNFTPRSSDNESDLAPSTTTTPERSKQSKALWDFVEVIGPFANRIQNHGTSSQRYSHPKVSCNSDGDETRTSDSGSKSDDNAEMPATLSSSLQYFNSSHNVDQVLSSFRDQRIQLESRYQQLNNQGLAEKVFRILTNQDPEMQANGILSEVSAEERETKARMVLQQYNKDFNFSFTSSGREESPSFGHPDNIRKKLDLSAISSVDSSRVFDKSFFNLPPSSKGFSAFDEAKKFLSTQTEKALERTFNHSIEMKFPQHIQCYPLLMDDSDKKSSEQETRKLPEPNSSEENIVDSHRDDSGRQKNAEEPRQDILETSPANSDQGTSSRPKEKYRPYRPPGSKEVYYTESDTASVADSVTTIESTHIGSDDAAGPNLPPSALGSRKDPPNVAGIYGTRKNLSTVQEGSELPTIEEKSGMDEKESETSQSHKDETARTAKTSAIHSAPRETLIGQTESSSLPSGYSLTRHRYNTSIWARDHTFSQGHPLGERGQENAHHGVAGTESLRIDPKAAHDHFAPSHSVSDARRNAQWSNWMEGKSRGAESVPVDENLDRKQEIDNDDDEVDQIRTQRNFPSDAFVSENRNEFGEKEQEPLSLKIHMTYTDDVKSQERKPPVHEGLEGRLRSPSMENSDQSQRSSTSHVCGYERCQPDALKNRSSFPELRSTSVSGANTRDTVQQQSMYRSVLDENLHHPVCDARLSPAFRRALSPELMNSIGHRSPLLSRHIQKSLAQPPSFYPLQAAKEKHSSRSPTERRPDCRSDLPTFLARDRPLSPLEYINGREHDRIGDENAFRHNDGVRLYEPPASHVESVSEDLRSRREVHFNSDRRWPSSEQRQENKEGNSNFKGQGMQPHKETTNIGKSPGSFAKRKVELTLEGMSSESEADTEMDKEPLSKRAQLLKEALSHQPEPNIRPDINSLWEQFKGLNESSESSINSSRMEAVADLLKSPSCHLVSQYLKEREEYRIERQERAEHERERRVKEQRLQFQKFSSSEDEIVERQNKLLAKKEEERVRRRASKKKPGGNADNQVASHNINEVDRRKEPNKAGDTLFSIPEDRSFEQSPSKSTSVSKSYKSQASTRKPHVIDPKMLNLRERIFKQRKKIDKDVMKEMLRIEKLKKLEQLLLAKKKGEITNETLEHQLEELSSTTPLASDNSQDSSRENHHNTILPFSDDSTTAKDSSGEMHAWKAQKEKRMKDREVLEKKNSGKYLTNNSNQNKNKLTHSATDNSQNSEIKLLKLVKKGYLTAEEAYKLALDRATRDGGPSAHDLSGVSSDSGNISHARRPHQFYSPYSRPDSNWSQRCRSAPKLKFSGSNVDNSLAFEEFEHKERSKAWGYRNEDEELDSSTENPLLCKFNSNSSQQENSSGINHRSQNAVPLMPHPYSSGTFRNRPRSLSPPNGRLYHGREKRTSATPSPPRQSSRRPHSTSPSRKLGKDNSELPGKTKRWVYHTSRKVSSENDSPRRKGQRASPGVAWHIDMTSPPDQWKQPLQEIPASAMNRAQHDAGHRFPQDKAGFETRTRKQDEHDSIWQMASHPRGISKCQWEQVVSQDALASKSNHWEVDPASDWVQYILNRRATSCSTEEDDSCLRGTESEDIRKSFSKLSLQEAFLTRRPDFISKCRERQKWMTLSKENRQMQECLRLEREVIFADQERIGMANLYAHPYSDNLYQPKRRILTKQEMKKMTARAYKKLPEVVEKKEDDRRKMENKLNRLRANLFNKKVQRDVLRKNLKTRG